MPPTSQEVAKPSPQSSLSSTEVEKIVENYVQKHARQGEIFRLDQPSYAAAEAAKEHSPEGFPAELSQGSIVFEEVVESQTEWDLEVPQVSNKEAASRLVEEDLREARIRVFNPVWEVDRLQWPHVCVELIRQRQDHLMRVARNLVQACHEGLQVLAVTSPQGGEGRTTVACCLAKLAAVSGLRVALVDGDIENPSLAFQTNLDLESDWKMALANEIPLEEVAVHSIDDQVTLIPLLEPLREDEIAEDDGRIVSMLQELTESFDLVIVDTGPLDSTRSLATTMSEQGVVNAVITVVDHRTSSQQRIEACLRRIRRTGVSSIGLVENFAN